MCKLFKLGHSFKRKLTFFMQVMSQVKQSQNEGAKHEHTFILISRYTYRVYLYTFLEIIHLKSFKSLTLAFIF